MKAKRVTGMLLVSALAVSLFTGCGGGSSENEGGIKEFTAFFAVPGAEINDDNEIQQIIAEKPVQRWTRHGLPVRQLLRR